MLKFFKRDIPFALLCNANIFDELLLRRQECRKKTVEYH